MKILKNLSILLVLPAMLAGCFQPLETDYMSTNQAREWTPWEPKAETVSSRQEDFYYKGGQLALTKAQANKLRHLVTTSDRKTHIFARIMIHGTIDELVSSPTEERVSNIVHLLIKAGVPQSAMDVITIHTPTVETGNTITVVVDQTKICPVKCDNWNYYVGGYVWPDGEPDFNCNNIANLSAMISNPRDAIEGRELETADAARTDVFEQYYRDDKIRPILKGERIISK